MTLTRLAPKMPAAAYQTYGVLRPASTHMREVDCRAYDCERWIKGWRMALDLAEPPQARAAKWIRDHSGRTWVVERQQGAIVTLAFGAGQQCLAGEFNTRLFGQRHMMALERVPLFTLAGGDWRGNPLGWKTQKLSPVSWRDHYGENQEKLADLVQRG